MAAKSPTPIHDKDLQGLKYFQLLGPLLQRLHDDATARDRAGNRLLHFDQYACLLLLFFFNPIVKSLRGIQQASALDKVQRLLGCERAALGSLSEASRVFDPQLLRDIIGTLATQAVPLLHGKEAEALRGLTAVDGSLLPALPKMAWALWLDPEHRAAKMHVHFDVLKGVPVEATVTAGNDSETQQLRTTLQAQRLYVIDRGYAEYQLFQDILDAHSSFIGRQKGSGVELKPNGPNKRAADVTIEAEDRRSPNPCGVGRGVVTSMLTGRAAIASAAVREGGEEETRLCRCTIGRTNGAGTAFTCYGWRNCSTGFSRACRPAFGPMSDPCRPSP